MINKFEKCFNFRHSVLLFVLLSICLLTYLFSMTRNPLPVNVFWVSVTSLSFLIIWQIDKVRDRSKEMMILFEIIILGTILHSIFVITVLYGLFGRDIHFDYYVAYTIGKAGWPLHNINILPRTLEYSRWPMMHILGLVFSKVTNIELFSIINEYTVTKILPTIINIPLPIIYYSMAKRMLSSYKPALLSTYLFIYIHYAIMFHSWFVRETLGYLLFFTLVFTTILRMYNKTIKITPLIVILSMALLFTHHLTFFVFILFIALCGVVKRDSHISLLFGLLVVLFIVYITYIGESLLSMINNIFIELVNPTLIYTNTLVRERTFEETIVLIMRFFYTGLFFILLILGVIKYTNRVNAKKIWGSLSLMWSVIMGFLIVLHSTLSRINVGGLGRIENFAWPIIFIGVSLSIYNIKHSKIKYALLLVLVSFTIFNIYLLPKYSYDPCALPNYNACDVSMKYNLSEYIICSIPFIPYNKSVVGDITVCELLGGLNQVKVVTDFSVYNGKYVKNANYNVLIFRNENYKVIRPVGKIVPKLPLNESYMKLNLNMKYNKIYTNRNVHIYNLKN